MNQITPRTITTEQLRSELGRDYLPTSPTRSDLSIECDRLATILHELGRRFVHATSINHAAVARCEDLIERMTNYRPR